MPEHEERLLEEKFHQEMLNIYRMAKAEINYNATRFLQLVSERRGLNAARYLLAGKVTDVSQGFTELALRERLDLSVENLVLKEPWRRLFTEAELRNARMRLREHEKKGS